MEELENIIKYKFIKPKLLKRALTHSSVSASPSENYERLEFLGDRVLGLAIADLLYKSFPNEQEGSLSQRLTGLVCKETVADVARILRLNEFMVVANNDIRNNDNVLCDVCEAVIGAIHADGGTAKAIAFINCHWIEFVNKNLLPPKDTKTMLQEFAHVKGLGMPIYKLVERKGTEHKPIFFISVALKGVEPMIGEGHSKKTAEFDAAMRMLKSIS